MGPTHPGDTFVTEPSQFDPVPLAARPVGRRINRARITFARPLQGVIAAEKAKVRAASLLAGMIVSLVMAGLWAVHDGPPPEFMAYAASWLR